MNVHKAFNWVQRLNLNQARATNLRLAWRNLWRYPRRTILLVVVVAYTTATTIFYWSCVDGYVESVLASHARYIAEPVLITKKQWFYDRDPSHTLTDLTFVKTLLEQKPIRAAAPRLELPVRIRSAYASESQIARGVDPYAEQALSNLPQKVFEGQWLSEPGKVLLGHKLAERLDARLGERIILDTASLEQPQARALRVVGLIKAGIDLVDQNAVLIHIDDARALTEVSSATSIALMVARGSETAVAKLITPLLPEGVAAYGVWDIVGPIKTDLIGAKLSAIPVGVLLNIFAIITVVSTVLVSVFERKKEFAVMQALGYLPHRLANMVVLESLLATFLGWLFGLSLGYGVAWMFATHNILGRLFAVSGRVWPSTGIAEELYAAVHPIYSLYALTIVILVVLFCILLTAPYVRNIKISEVIRSL